VYAKAALRAMPDMFLSAAAAAVLQCGRAAVTVIDHLADSTAAHYSKINHSPA
jgi:hypothetical protein